MPNKIMRLDLLVLFFPSHSQNRNQIHLARETEMPTKSCVHNIPQESLKVILGQRLKITLQSKNKPENGQCALVLEGIFRGYLK